MGIGLQRGADKVLPQGFDGADVGKNYEAVQQLAEQNNAKENGKDTQSAAFFLFLLLFWLILSDLFRLLDVIRKLKVILVEALDGATPPCKNQKS